MNNLLAYASEHPLVAAACVLVIAIASFAWMTR